MRLSTLNSRTLQQINQLTSLQPFDHSPFNNRPIQFLEPLCNEPSSDDLLLTNFTFGSEKNDIKPVFSGKKFLSLTEDLLNTHIQLSIHKNNSEEFETLPTDHVRPGSTKEDGALVQEDEPDDIVFKEHNENFEKETDLLEYPKKVYVRKEQKDIEKLIKQAKLEEYLPQVDLKYQTEGLYSVKSFNLESLLGELFPFMKIGHRRRLGVVILEERGEFKRQGMLKLTENALLAKKLDESDKENQGQGEKEAENETRTAKLPSIEEWLDSAKMWKYRESFICNGYDDYEFLLLMMCSECFMLNDMNLRNDLKISEYEDRNEILTRLYRDRYNVINIDTGVMIGKDGPEPQNFKESSSCKTCSIF